MVVKIRIDIIGGSLSGLSAASSLKTYDKSLKVIVHEKHKKIGFNHEGRRCGEAHSVENEWMKWKPTGNSIFNIITKGEGIIGNKKYVIHRTPNTAFILNRPEFICQLAKEAERLGAEIQTNDKIKTLYDLGGDYIIDASGCPSIIKREKGFNKGIRANTYQQTIEDSNLFISDTVRVYYVDGGYFWIFPRNPDKKEINLGVGIVEKIKCNLKKMLEDFKEKNKIYGKVNYVTGGLVPLGLQRPLSYKNILFVGDAGVGTYPFTAQGIYRALISGEIAGRCIANRYPKKYPYLMYKDFIKWDLIGKMFLWTSSFIREINPKLSLSYLNYFWSFSDLVHL
jgi:flavin-dependent dehydrogenase